MIPTSSKVLLFTHAGRVVVLDSHSSVEFPFSSFSFLCPGRSVFRPATTSGPGFDDSSRQESNFLSLFVFSSAFVVPVPLCDGHSYHLCDQSPLFLELKALFPPFIASSIMDLFINSSSIHPQPSYHVPFSRAGVSTTVFFRARAKTYHTSRERSSTSTRVTKHVTFESQSPIRAIYN